MDQNVDAVHGDNHAFHIELRRSVVGLIYSQVGGGVSFTVPAIPIVSVNDFCYMISLSTVFTREDVLNWRHRVLFSDGTLVTVRIQDVRMQGALAAFSVSTTAELPDPVKFSQQQVSHNQEVYTLSVEGRREPSLLIRGRVTHVGRRAFYHDCTPSTSTANGGPVFNEQGELVGICYCNRGVIGTMNMNRISELLSVIDDNMANMSLSQIVQHLEVLNQGN